MRQLTGIVLVVWITTGVLFAEAQTSVEVGTNHKENIEPTSRPKFGERTMGVDCFTGDKHHSVVEGFFDDRKNGERSLLYLSNRGDGGCYLDHEGGGDFARLTPDFARFVATCRAPRSGKDQAIIWTITGNRSAELQVWAVDPLNSSPRRLYREAWGELSADDFPPERTLDGPLAPGFGESQAKYPFVAANGACVWQSRQKQRQSFHKAMVELQIGKEAHEQFDKQISALFVNDAQNNSRAIELPMRSVSASTVYYWLRELKSAVVFEGARYASHDDKNKWLIVQLFGRWHCDAGGVVLLLDRQVGLWKTIYNIQSGCSYDLNYPLQGMLIRDGKLYFRACMGGTGCMYHGEYHEFSFDLSTNIATPLEFESHPVWPYDKSNPMLTNLFEEMNLK